MINDDLMEISSGCCRAISYEHGLALSRGPVMASKRRQGTRKKLHAPNRIRLGSALSSERECVCVCDSCLDRPKQRERGGPLDRQPVSECAFAENIRELGAVSGMQPNGPCLQRERGGGGGGGRGK